VSFIRPDVPLPPAAPDDPRIGHLLGRKLADGRQARAVIIGFPTDEGVRRNGGRTGAAAAPAAIRRALYRMTPDAAAPAPFIELLEHTQDLGDLGTSADLEGDQERLGAVVAEVLMAGAFPIVLGGGHETSYGHFLGYVQSESEVTLLNWDAHPDVRPLIEGRGHSGSPFRQALLHPSGLAGRYVVAGLLPQSIAAAHLAFVRERGEAVPREALTAGRINVVYNSVKAPVLASFDIDAVAEAFAPGVSAPSVDGMTPDLWLTAAYAAGRSPLVTSFDLVETNPSFDRDQQTARLAALTVWQVLRGLAERALPAEGEGGDNERGPRRKRRRRGGGGTPAQGEPQS
jgi:formiminoglutamase